MLWLLLSNKRSYAPFLYILLHLGLLIFSVILCPIFTEITRHAEICLFWLNVIITNMIYFVCHWKDPGYIPYDAVFFTDQEEAAVSCRPQSKLKGSGSSHTSHIKLDASNLDKSPEGKDSILNSQNPSTMILNRDVQDMLEKPNKKTHPARVQEILILENEFSKSQKKEEISSLFNNNQLNEQINKASSDIELPIAKPISKPEPKDETARDPKCEISMDIESSFMNYEANHNENGIANTNLGDKLNQLEDNDDLDDSEKIKIDSQQLVEYKSKSVLMLGTTNMDQTQDHYLNKITEERNTQSSQTLTTGCFNIKSQIGDDDLNKPIKITDYGAKPSAYAPLNEEEMIATPREVIIRVNFETVNKGQQIIDAKKELETTGDNLDPPGSERVADHIYIPQTGEIKNHPIKENPSRNESKQEVIKPDDNLSSDGFGKSKDNEEVEIIYVERRYCTICNIEQPIRSKHCKICQRCCASYDHHCPWLGSFFLFINYSFVYVKYMDTI